MRPGIRLGVDVGAVRVGVALSDPSGLLATPHATVERRWEAADGIRTVGEAGSTDQDDTSAEDDIAEIVALARRTEAVEVVVGLPRSLDGGEGPSAAAARAYAAELARRVAPVSVRLVDERLTSVDAHRALRDSGVSGRRQRAVVDQAAAVLILQGALDAERGTGRPPGEPVGQKRRKPRTKDGQR
ncbi:putative Holliday junction resolvase [Knoellia remsis]|uniref:Putative pre-16S rRNA nuclease n=1 Tax=Knoellia remsis TaxID=407159 RepID=A0A2T0UUC5_9MICO|nr:Holliday junction resolvase RuvX [Knoellia remsis]PRY61447.1 putative Holliday junction resolvase [Knoellia remsis]